MSTHRRRGKSTHKSDYNLRCLANEYNQIYDYLRRPSLPAGRKESARTTDRETASETAISDDDTESSSNAADDSSTQASVGLNDSRVNRQSQESSSEDGIPGSFETSDQEAELEPIILSSITPGPYSEPALGSTSKLFSLATGKLSAIASQVLLPIWTFISAILTEFLSLLHLVMRILPTRLIAILLVFLVFSTAYTWLQASSCKIITSIPSGLDILNLQNICISKDTKVELQDHMEQTQMAASNFSQVQITSVEDLAILLNSLTRLPHRMTGLARIIYKLQFPEAVKLGSAITEYTIKVDKARDHTFSFAGQMQYTSTILTITTESLASHIRSAQEERSRSFPAALTFLWNKICGLESLEESILRMYTRYLESLISKVESAINLAELALDGLNAMSNAWGPVREYLAEHGAEIRERSRILNEKSWLWPKSDARIKTASQAQAQVEVLGHLSDIYLENRLTETIVVLMNTREMLRRLLDDLNRDDVAYSHIAPAPLIQMLLAQVPEFNNNNALFAQKRKKIYELISDSEKEMKKEGYMKWFTT